MAVLDSQSPSDAAEPLAATQQYCLPDPKNFAGIAQRSQVQLANKVTSISHEMNPPAAADLWQLQNRTFESQPRTDNDLPQAL
jgi:hypothetical protein